MKPEPTQASAPGKIILFGEHAVVYGRPAIAAPVTQAKAKVTVKSARPGSGLVLVAADLEMRAALDTAPVDDPLAAAARLTLAHVDAPCPDAVAVIRSTIPIASGLGSGAAVSTALVRGLAEFLGLKLPPAEVSAIVFEVEKIHHGTPSGIDNTVIAYEQPVYFVRDPRGSEHARIEPLRVGARFKLLIADTGVSSPTRLVVEDVRRGWQREPARYEALFDQIGAIAEAGRGAIERGEVEALGPLMDENHELLVELGVSSSRLNRLLAAARSAKALGAKLSGGGRGGNMLALVEEAGADAAGERLTEALKNAGAVNVIETIVTPSTAERD